MSAKDMFYPEGKEFSHAEDRLYAREGLVYNVTEDILVAMDDLGVTKKELARRLGKSASFVTQTLSGARNMTLGTLSDICFELGFEPRVTAMPVSSENIIQEYQVNGSQKECEYYGSEQNVVSIESIQFNADSRKLGEIQTIVSHELENAYAS